VTSGGPGLIDGIDSIGEECDFEPTLRTSNTRPRWELEESEPLLYRGGCENKEEMKRDAEFTNVFNLLILKGGGVTLR